MLQQSSVKVAHPINPPASRISAETLAVVINDNDPNSVIVGEYYRTASNIPHKNIVHVHIPDSPRKLSAAAFAELNQQLEA